MKWYKVKFKKRHPSFAYKVGAQGVINSTYDLDQLVKDGYISSDYTELKPETPAKKRQTRSKKN